MMTAAAAAVEFSGGAGRFVFAGDRPDWFFLDRRLFSRLHGAPGVQCDRWTRQLRVHRTHLPLLPPGLLSAEIAMRLADGHGVSLDDRATIDADLSRCDWCLREYQYPGVTFIRHRRGTLLAWQQRLGKTAVIVASHDLDRDGQLLVVAPLAARGVWLNWFARRWPNVRPVVVVGRRFPAAKLHAAPLILMHYEIALSAQMFGFKRLGTAVFDEAHVLSNARSRRFQAGCIFSTQAARVILSTGTPVWNRPAGLYQFLMLLAPGAWGSWRDWVLRYCDGRRTAYGVAPRGASNTEELRQRLTEVASQLLWTDVLRGHEEEACRTTRKVVLVPISPEQGRELVTLAEEARAAGTHRAVIGEIARMRRILGAAKWRVAVGLAQDLLAAGERVVIWAWHQDLAVRIAKELATPEGPPVRLIHGAVRGDRDAEIEEWRQKGGALVITMAVGQTAIDLSAATHAIFAEQDWTPAVIGQAEMRTFAPQRPMHITHVVADHWVDVRIVNALALKVDLARGTGLPAAETAVDLLQSALHGDQALADDFRGLLAADRLGGEDGADADREYSSADYFGDAGGE